MIALPPCRWRGNRLPNGNYECSSAKLIVKPSGVSGETCSKRCYCVDHEAVARRVQSAVMPIAIRRVSLCIHFIDGKPAPGHTDGKTWVKCEAMNKDVCVCRDCTNGCEKYETA